MAPGNVECAACGGSGQSSAGGECYPCQGTGSTQREVTIQADEPLPGGTPPPGAAEALSVLPQHTSKTAEHYTPQHVVEAARSVLGAIDLDPASCPMAQEIVQAAAWYGPGSPYGEDGLAEPWLGRVFCNPPGGRVPEAYGDMGTKSQAALWWATLAEAWRTGEVEAAIFVGFTLEILRSAQALPVPQPLDFPLCVPSSRIAFDTVEDGKRVGSSQPSHANVIVFLPNVEHRGTWNLWDFGELEMFRQTFEPLGKVWT